MEKSKNKRIVRGVPLLFMLYITSWMCYTGDDIRILLYGGYGVVCGLAFLKIMLSGYGSSIYIPKATERLFLFSVFCAGSTLWAVNTSGAINDSIFVFACVIMVILLNNYFIRLGNVEMLFTTIIVIGITMAIVVIIKEGGISSFYARAIVESRYGIRVGGEVFNANSIGISCAYSSVFLFFFAVFYKKWYCYFIMIIPTLALIASASKKAILLFGAGVLLVLYYSQKKENNIQKYLKYLIGFFVGIFVLRFVLSLDIMQSVVTRMNLFLNLFRTSGRTTIVDASSSMRLNLIIEGLKQFFRTPFLGIGMSGSVVLNASRLNFPAYSHCDYVEHLVNGGIVGFLIYYSIFWILIKDYIFLMKKDDDPKLIISFISIILFLIMNFACVTYYIEMTTYLYFILWISQIEIKKRELLNKEKKESNVEGDSNG